VLKPATSTSWFSACCRNRQDKISIEARLKVIQDQLDQIDNFSVKRDFAGVDWAAKPILPEMPSFPKLTMTMTLAITLGLALALGIAFLRELMDTSIRSPRDISRVRQHETCLGHGCRTRTTIHSPPAPACRW